MNENPYQPPSDPPSPVGEKRVGYDQLKRIAHSQKAIVICVGFVLGAMVGELVVPSSWQGILRFGLGISLLLGTICLMVQGVRLYGVALGLILAVFALSPYTVLVVLLLLHFKANRVLKQHGIKVGWLGANLCQLEDT